jgi:hypothetical protein
MICGQASFKAGRFMHHLLDFPIVAHAALLDIGWVKAQKHPKIPRNQTWFKHFGERPEPSAGKMP